jgi:UDP-N-acetylglucosamine acyltransferase
MAAKFAFRYILAPMPRIHPSSLVDSQVQLADDVEIGPFCVIRGPVSIGAGTRLIGNVYITGPVKLGRGNLIYPFTSLGMEPQYRKYAPREQDPGVIIGDNNVLREGFSVHRGISAAPTTIGNDNYLMCYSHVGHDAVVGNFCTFANSVALAGHVLVQDQVTIGGNTVIHQFARLGRLCMLSGSIGVSQDVPPFCMAYNMRQVESLNLVGLRRAGCRDHIDNLREAFRILYQRGHTSRNAAELIDQQLGHDPLCRELAEFVRQSKRGITDSRPSSGTA